MKLSAIVVFIVIGISKMPIAASQEFTPGQEWSYQARTQDTASTVVIGAVEDHPDSGVVIHISIQNVHIGESVTKIGHIPISSEALRSSVTQLRSETGDTEGIADGIAAWREASGGVFTISVAEAVEYIEQISLGAVPNE
jgi:hypothetical protein